MLIGVCGARCAGKQSVTEYLIRHESFEPICIVPDKRSEEIPDHQGSNDWPEARSFSNVDALLHFVTQHWGKRWILPGLHSQETLEILQRRPFFILISIEAPVGLRFTRCNERARKLGDKAVTLDDFVTMHDTETFDARHNLAALTQSAAIRIVNQTTSIQRLYGTLQQLNLTDERRLRPNWDTYFMQLASLAALRSNCMKRRVGCVLVRDRRVISTGYNGTPRNLRNCNEGGCPRCNSGSAAGVGLATCLCIHAEENALLEAGRERIREAAILYCDTCPCLTCSIKITQVGISEVVYSYEYGMDKQAAAVFREGGVNLRQFTPPRTGLIHLSDVA